MKQRILGCTSLKISELCLGTMNFGWQTDESVSLAILDAYHASGGSFVQAFGLPHPFPPSSLSPAFSEAIVGHWRHQRGIARHQLVLATRITVGTASGTAEIRDALRRSVEASLARFRTDYLDLLICEWTGAGTPPPELRYALDALTRAGLVRYLAFSGVPAWRVMASLRDGFDRNHRRPDALQANYSLLARTAFELDLASLCREQRLGFFACMPLAGGILARHKNPLAFRPFRRTRLTERYGSDLTSRVAHVVAELADQRGCSSAQLALSWVLHHTGVTAAVVGVQSVDHWHDLAMATNLVLTADELARLHHATNVQRLNLPPRIDEKILASTRALSRAASEELQIA